MQKKSLLATVIASVFSIVAFAADGVYTATAQGQSGPVLVSVTVKDNKVTRIEVGPNKETSHYQANEGGQVVPAEVVLENNDGKERKYRERDALLDDFELNETERTAVAFKPNAVGRHHEAVFKESDRPGKKHDRVDRPGAEVDDLHGLEL